MILLWCTITMWSRADGRSATTPQRTSSEAQSGWLFLSPNLIGFLLFFAGPLIFSLVISFYEWDGITSPTFVGLGNYIADSRPDGREFGRRACRPATRTSSPRRSA